MMWYFQIFLLLFYFCGEGHSQDWNIINKATDYGQNVTLFCIINKCCYKNSGFDIFDPERRTLWIDVRGVDVDIFAKYVPFTNKEGFGMTIRNVMEEDLGIGYGCTYGLDEGEPKILTETLAFKGPDWKVSRQILKFGQHLTLLCLITNCCTKLSTWQVYKTKQVEIYKNGSGLPSSKAKYVVGNSQNGFSLTIRHLAKEDLNISYACKYGKRLGDPKLLLEDDAFKINRDGESNSGGNYVLMHVFLVCTNLAIVFFGTVVCVLLFKQRCKREAKLVKRLNMARSELDDISCSVSETRRLTQGEAKPVKHLNLDDIACIEHDNVSSRDPETKTLLPVEKDSGLSYEENNFMRFFLLCNKIGTESVRHYFDRKIPPDLLINHLSSHYISLINNRRLTTEQIQCLFPGPSSFGKSADFDFILLYSLIRNTLVKIIPPPTQGWGNQPQSWNITEEDDIERIRQYRNKMAHNTEFQIPDFEFNTMWSDLSQAVSRLSLGVLAPDISELKGQTLNCTYKTGVEKCIKEDIKEIKDNIEAIKRDQSDLRENIKPMKDDLEVLIQEH